MTFTPKSSTSNGRSSWSTWCLRGRDGCGYPARRLGRDRWRTDLRRAVVEVAQCRLEVNNVSARLHMVAPELAQWLSGQSAASLRQVAKDDQAAYLDKFAAARAAHSLWFALDADPLAAALESVYEAQAARGNLDALRAVVSRALTAS